MIPPSSNNKAEKRVALERLPRTEEGQSRYLHPHGYVIERERRDWGGRLGRMNGQADHLGPISWWTVRLHIARRRSMLDGKLPAFREVTSEKYGRARDFDTLRDARQWCDENPREGWASGAG